LLITVKEACASVDPHFHGYVGALPENRIDSSTAMEVLIMYAECISSSKSSLGQGNRLRCSKAEGLTYLAFAEKVLPPSNHTFYQTLRWTCASTNLHLFPLQFNNRLKVNAITVEHIARRLRMQLMVCRDPRGVFMSPSIVLLDEIHQINHLGLAHRRAHRPVCFAQDPKRKDDPESVEEGEIQPAEISQYGVRSCLCCDENCGVVEL
jgi:hypothetical protein